MAALHAVQVNFVPAPEGLSPSQLFELWPSLPDVAELVASSGVRVSVIQAAARTQRVTRNGIDYYFIDHGSSARGSIDHGGKGIITSRAAWGRRVAGMLGELKADIAHLHGLEFAEAAAVIARRLPHLPIVLQDHANRRPHWWRRSRWRQWYAAASGIAFTALGQAEPFVRAGLFASHTRLFAIPESSSRFRPGERIAARAETGLHGDPCLLWVGHLSMGKDPMTVLDGVAEAVSRLPNLQLWCAYDDTMLLAEVEHRIARDLRLDGRVHLLGKVAHARVERLMQAADVFVSGSHAEGSGYALLEALACGTTPVVTDIPSFRALTGDGGVGRLWPCGDAGRLADALVEVAQHRGSAQRVRAYFDAMLSFEAVGRQWADAYTQLCDASRQRA